MGGGGKLQIRGQTTRSRQTGTDNKRERLVCWLEREKEGVDGFIPCEGDKEEGKLSRSLSVLSGQRATTSGEVTGIRMYDVF